jgi:hypothetical protein
MRRLDAAPAATGVTSRSDSSATSAVMSFVRLAGGRRSFAARW